MENMTGRVERMVRRSAKRRFWHRAVAIPAAIVVFVTTYALILPAIAMEKDTYCGFEAHQHSDECYTAQLACGFEDGAVVQDVQIWTELTCAVDVHQHTEACFDENGNVVCGVADYVVHTHNADCYDANGALVCALPEVEAHTHDEGCYVEEIVNVCGQNESEGHVHTADCYTMISHPELVCGLAESAGHIHNADCYTTTENTYLACGMEEQEGHIHSDACYTTYTAEDGTEITELTCALPESLGHVHTEACYVTEPVVELTCGLEESTGHTHNESCWVDMETMELTCGKEETAGHTHTEDCFAAEKRLVCAKPEVILHTHTDECYTVVGLAEDGTEIRELTCPMTVVQEHVHTADCFTQVEQTVERPHEHTDLCYIQVLSCTLPEHEHTDECYIAPEEPEVTEAPAYICGMEEHAHTDVCYDENGEPICGIEEHIHDETCLPVIIEGDTTEIVEGDVEIVEDDTPHFQLPILVCGLAEHEHSTNCMDENMVYVCGLTQHTHTGACYDIPGMDGVTPELTCALHEHFHTEACYNENGELACGLEEHTHTVGCFALPEGAAEPEATEEPAQPTWCGKAEHTHDETCLDENGVVVCGLPEHTHDESCFVEPTWYCGLAAHTHDESCLDAAGQPVCGLPEHTHDESCLIPNVYYCGLEEHIHGEACYDETGNLICGLEEHTHDESCLVEPIYYCGKIEHIHDETCYDEAGNLICGLEEHIHDASCLIQDLMQMAQTDDILVTARYTSEAGIPDDAVLRVTRITDEDHLGARLDEANQVFDETNPDQVFWPLALLNIGFYQPDGTEAEPLAPVDVTVQMLNADGLAEGEQYTVIHYGAAGTELLDVDSGSEDVAFTSESFSDFLISYDADPSDGGSTDPLPAEEGEDEGTVPPIIMGAPFDPNFLLGYSASSENEENGIMTIDSPSTATKFAHSKRIDYLGNNTKSGGGTDKDNPDTDADNSSKNITDDLYRLYLDMEGKSEPVDLVIVIDRSNSMKETMTGGKTRWRTVYDILEGTKSDGSDGLLYEFLKQNDGKTSNAEKNFVSVVWFAGQFYDRSILSSYGSLTNAIPPNNSKEGGTVLAWTSKYTHQGTTNYTISSYKGVSWGVACTNYVAGFYQADQKLHKLPSGTENHRKVVVFMSDGIPVYYYMAKDMSWTSPGSMRRYGGGAEDYTYVDWSGSNLIYNYNNNRNHKATSFYKSPYFNETLKIFNGASNSFKTRNPNIAFHTVAIDLEKEKINGWDRTTLLKDMAAAYSGTTYSATNSAGLKQYLKSVMFPAGVTISDTLSAYVDLYADNSDILVTATPKTGSNKNPITLWIYTGKNPSADSTKGAITKNVTWGTTKIDGTDPKNIIKSVTYDGKKISVVFQDNYCLSGDYTYTLSFNVRLTQAAYDTYADNMNNGGNAYDYNKNGAQGMTGTDYTGNATSSGKDGFHSNSSATVSYQINGKTSSLTYDHPVVQPWGTKLQVFKTADDRAESQGVPNVTFQLRQGTDNVLKELQTNSSGLVDFGWLKTGSYTLWEKVPENYESGNAANRLKQWMSFEVFHGRIIHVQTVAGATWNGDANSLKTAYDATFKSKPNTNYEGGQVQVTVKNTSFKQPVSIYKEDQNGENLAGAKFNLYWMNESNEFVECHIPEGATWNGSTGSDENGLIFDGKLPYGTYKLVETEAPKGYEMLEKNEVIFKVTESQVVIDPVNPQAYIMDSGEGFKITVTDKSFMVDWGILKVDSTNSSRLSGAEFTLYGPYEPNSSFDQATGKFLWSGVTDANGELTNGKDGTELPDLEGWAEYYLVETDAPDGYYKLAEPIKLTMQKNAEGKYVLSAYMGGTQRTVTPDGDNKYVVEVPNSTGYELPESGGIGTTVFYVSGLALTALAGAVFCARKRREARG